MHEMNMVEKSKLKMTFEPKVIEHLGVRMYSTLSPVLSELVANAYDADAKKVVVELHDKEEKKIIVKDDGSGMSLDDIQAKFLLIGRNRREAEKNRRTPGGRQPIGKKGLGKLSFFGIVNTITVDTVKKDKRNVFVMDWDRMMKSSGDYLVEHPVRNGIPNHEQGTIITLTNIKRKTDFDGKSIAHCLSRFFVFDAEFSVSVQHNNGKPVEATNEMRFDQLDQEFFWDFPKDLKKSKHYPYLVEHDIKGRVITSIEPISPNMRARGIALFSRQKLVQAPSFYGESTSSHFFSYLSGSLSVDFIDEIAEDVIATNRLSLNWEHPEMHKLQSVLTECIGYIHRRWRNKRKKRARKKIKARIQSGWYGSMPAKQRKEVKKLVDALLLSAEEQDTTKEDLIAESIGLLQEAIPPYPFFHWQNIHESLHKPLKGFYDKKDFLGAARDGAQIYEDAVRKKSRVVDPDGVKLYRRVFSEQNPILKIPHPFKWRPKTNTAIQEGQQFLSVGLAQSFRNPISHSTQSVNQKFFTEEDFLDVLSLISFLLRRVDKSEKINIAKKRRKKK